MTRRAGTLLALLALLALIPAPRSLAQDSTPPYLDPAQSVAARVEDLLARMSVDEKIGQVLQVSRDYLGSEADIARFGLGSILSGGGSGPTVNDPVHWADMIDGYQRAALSSRLGIPILYGIDAVHGHNNVRGAVIFPQNIGMGAADDPQLCEDEGRVTALEMLATGARWDFGPCLAVPRDLRWGRSYEGFGQEPELVGELGAAEIRGLQSGGLGSATAVLATPKHFAGDGGTKGGIDRGDAVYAEPDFLRLFVAPYRDAISAGAECAMVSFSSWNGLQDHGNRHLLTDILRGDLGFEGFVVSDWGGVALLPGADESERIARAVNAGVDMIMVPDVYEAYFRDVQALVAGGSIPASRLDEAVRRILRAKFELGLFERPFSDRSLLGEVGSPEHRAVARKAVAESLVVLKNDGGLLPISSTTKRILVDGSRAQDMGAQCGGWTITWQGMRALSIPGTTIYDGIAAAAKARDIEVAYSPDGRAPQGFKPDLVIAVVGEDPYAEGRGDSRDLALGYSDKALARKAAVGAAACKAPLLLILLSGRPLLVGDELAESQAFVAAWLPGSEGEGVADLLFGDAPARGKLPCSWPATLAQVPVDGAEAQGCLFPTGYGLEP